MKTYFLLILSVILFASCNNDKTKDVDTSMTTEQEVQFQSFGEPIQPTDAIDEKQLAKTYENLRPGDTVAVKFKAEVNAVCQSKGCWMKMDVGEEEAMVKFKDYGFFMPKDIAGEEVIVEGKAFVEEMSVEEQKHYAEDAGKSPEEIAMITAPKRTLSFISNGVLIPENN
ncbi:MAG: DUF4920 domain-containing protein [Flavobacteriaceae bacterium]|nr:DUF4920 domain-containing protein [Flavobacteriaceae bacterium]